MAADVMAINAMVVEMGILVVSVANMARVDGMGEIVVILVVGVTVMLSMLL